MSWHAETVRQDIQIWAEDSYAYFIVFILVPNKSIAEQPSDVQRECFAGNSISAGGSSISADGLTESTRACFSSSGQQHFQKEKQSQHDGELFLKEVQCLVQNLACLWANSQASVDEFTWWLVDVIVDGLVVVLCKEMICFPGQICLPVWRVHIYLLQNMQQGKCFENPGYPRSESGVFGCSCQSALFTTFLFFFHWGLKHELKTAVEANKT